MLTDGVMGWKSSQQTHCAKFLTGHVVSIITTQALSGCQNSHYTTEKGKASVLRELNVARTEKGKASALGELNVARSEVLHYDVGGGGGWGWGCNLFNKRWDMQNGMC